MNRRAHLTLAERSKPMEITFAMFQVSGNNLSCEGCGTHLSDRAIKIPGLAGVHCSLSCIEAHLFGSESCRWCGFKTEKAYTGIDSRLCSDGCSQSYYQHVVGDRTAALGTGKRFMLWLQRKRPDIYAQLVGEQASDRLGRPTKSGYAMSAAERVREHRRKKALQVPTFVTSGDLASNLQEVRM